MKLNDRVHVVTTDGEIHNAWFVNNDTDGFAVIELDDNCFTSVRVPRAKLRTRWHSSAL